MGFWSKIRKKSEPVRDVVAVEAAVAEMVAPVKAAAAATYPLSDPDLRERLFGVPAAVVTPDVAMGQAAFYTCVALIAGQIARMPIVCYRRVGASPEIDTDSPQARVLGVRPASRYSRTTFWRQIVANMLCEGNGVAWIERRGAHPFALWPVPWRRTGVSAYRSPMGETRLSYWLTLDDGRIITADQDDVLHIGGSPVWNIFYFASPLTAYARTVGIAIGADKMAEAYFKNAANPGGYISIKTPLKGGPQQADQWRDEWRRRYAGADNFSGPAVLDQGAEFVPIAINAADAQLVESRSFNAVDIARIFHVPPHLVNVFDKVQAFGKGLEELNQGFFDYAMAPHVQAITDELNYKLFGGRPDRYCEFDAEALLAGNIKTQSEAFQLQLGGAQGPGWRSVNEVRQAKGLPPIAGDDFDKPLQWGAVAPQKPASGKASPETATPGKD